MKNLILEGFMGCGKSHIAACLSSELDMPLIDTDAEIEKKQGISIAEIFEKKGEEAFRDMETSELEELLGLKEGAVISLGGGMPVRKENREILKKLGTVIYLKASVKQLLKRLENGVEERPMLKGYDLEERVRSLLDEREEYYIDASDLVIDIEGTDTPKEATQRIRKALGI